ncbi:MAG: hypothetical protein WA885_22380 [Phormidesmis sp.]
MIRPSLPGKKQLARFPLKAFLVIQNQALPVFQRGVRLSVGLGGLVSVMGMPALAIAPPPHGKIAVSEKPGNLASSAAVSQPVVSLPEQFVSTGLEILDLKASDPEISDANFMPEWVQLAEPTLEELAAPGAKRDTSDWLVRPARHLNAMPAITSLSAIASPSPPVDIESAASELVTTESTAAEPTLAQVPELRIPPSPRSQNPANDELGNLRLQQVRSRENEELGILRLIQTAQARARTKPPSKQPITFLTGRLGYFHSENAFRSDPSLSEEIYQSGLAFYAFPKLSADTSLYAIAETNLARYEELDRVSYNELEVQLGLRQRLFPRTYAQIGWRNQRLYSPGYREKLFSVNYIDTLISHRSILNSKTWLDSFYQLRYGFADPETASRLRQTVTMSLNYGITRDLRTSLLYQLDFDDYTEVSRYDTYQQVLGIISYRLTPESRISLFGGTRFGRSSSPGVDLDDTFYGAGLNVNVPLF